MTVWFVWGSTFLGIRVSVSSIPPFLMAGTRYLIAGAILASVLWLAQGRRREAVRWSDFKSIALSAVLLLVIGNGLLSYGEVHLQSGTAALIVATVPLWMLIIDALLTRTFRPAAIAGIVVGTAGVIALVGGPSAHVSVVDAAAVLVGSLSWAIGSVIVRQHSSQRTNPLFPALEMVIAGALLSLVALATGEVSSFHFSQVSHASISGYVYLVLVGSMVGYTAYGYAVRSLPTTIVATYAYVNPIVAVLLGALLLHEPLSLNVLLGGGAIIVSVVLTMVPFHRLGSSRSLRATTRSRSPRRYSPDGAAPLRTGEPHQ